MFEKAEKTEQKAEKVTILIAECVTKLKDRKAEK